MTNPTPPPFVYGTATSSYQIEGAVHADGRGPSIWDTFAADPGRILDRSDGSVACASYERLDDDLALLEGLGVGAYRFSVAWPRVQPDGRTTGPTGGLDYYERLVDGLLARGIQPIPTLYHWDLPQPLEDAGGWPVRETSERFADYSAVVARRLADRVTTWATLNEPWCSAFLGYASGVHAPGRREPRAAFAAAHHLLLGHALGAEALHSVRSDLDVGIVLNLYAVYPEGPQWTDAADYVDAVQNRLWLDALVDGSYPAVLVPLADEDLVRPGDLAAISASAHWLGVNFYTALRVGDPALAAETSATEVAAFPGAPPFGFLPREPVTAMGWEVVPSALEDVLSRLSRRAPGLPLRITENGAAFADEKRAPDGTVDDEDRIDYLRGHLAAVHRAREAGADIRGYLAWSLMDNFEWSYGYTKRFGLAEIEPGTLRRVPKRSYAWYAETIRRGRPD